MPRLQGFVQSKHLRVSSKFRLDNSPVRTNGCTQVFRGRGLRIEPGRPSEAVSPGFSRKGGRLVQRDAAQEAEIVKHFARPEYY